MSNEEFRARLLSIAGFTIAIFGPLVYFPRWLRAACPCCNPDAQPLYTVRLLAGLAIVYAFRYVYLWRTAALRRTRGANEVAPAAPMTEREGNARIGAAYASFLLAVLADMTIDGEISHAYLCCDVEQWPFVLVRWLAAIMVGMIVYYLFGRAITRRVNAFKRMNEAFKKLNG